MEELYEPANKIARRLKTYDCIIEPMFSAVKKEIKMRNRMVNCYPVSYCIAHFAEEKAKLKLPIYKNYRTFGGVKCHSSQDEKILIMDDEERGIPAGRAMTKDEMIEWNKRHPFRRDMVANLLALYTQREAERYV
ncbi:MAG: hypothetical protein RR415_08875 [Ruthenibacterium sp.]